MIAEAFDRWAEVPVSGVQRLDLGLSCLCLVSTAMAEEVAMGTPPAWLPGSLAPVLTLSRSCAA